MIGFANFFDALKAIHRNLIPRLCCIWIYTMILIRVYLIEILNNMEFICFDRFSQIKMEYQMIVVAFVALVAVSVSNVSASKEILNTPALCEPSVIESMPPHIRKVCLALENSNQLSSALNQYIHKEAAGKMSLKLPMFSLLSLVVYQFNNLHLII